MTKKLSVQRDFFKSSITDFLNKLGSASPYPGGGSAAALIAATGVSLIEMVTRINEQRDMKRSNRKSPSTPSKNRVLKLVNLRANFGKLMMRDIAAFSKLSSFPKEKRQAPAYEKALQGAATIPLIMARLIAEAMALGEIEVRRTSRWLASDLAEAAILLEAAFGSARLNVEINLVSLRPGKFRNQCEGELDWIEKSVLRSKKALLKVMPV